MNNSIPPINIWAFLLSSTFGPGEEGKKDPECTFSGSSSRDRHQNPAIIYDRDFCTLSGGHISHSREEGKGAVGRINQERHPRGGDLSPILLVCLENSSGCSFFKFPKLDLARWVVCCQKNTFWSPLTSLVMNCWLEILQYLRFLATSYPAPIMVHRRQRQWSWAKWISRNYTNTCSSLSLASMPAEST